MTPEFAKAADPVFLYVLELLDRIERNEPLVVADERMRVRAAIDRAEAMLGRRDDWELAKYGLVAWIDDLLINAPWDGRLWWKENALEFEIFNTADAYTMFYSKADDAAKMVRKDALEVFYVCVVLGFRGLYRDAEGAGLAEQLGMPPDLDSWARKTSMAIQLGQGRPPIAEAPRPGEGAPPLEGKFNLVAMSLALVSLSAITVILGCLMLFA